jgi:hypothetical protein
VFAEEGTDSLKAPLTSVTVPAVDPFATMETPGSGEPSFESVTLPVTTVCAIAETEIKQSNATQLTFSKDFKYIQFGFKGYTG